MITLLVLASLSWTIQSFSPASKHGVTTATPATATTTTSQRMPSSLHAANPISRRSLLLGGTLLSTTAAAAATAAIAASTCFSRPASAVVVATEPATAATKVFAIGRDMSLDDAKDRFRSAQRDLTYLLEHFDAVIAQGGGDNVRRYLGTVGVSSGMYGITKVMKRLQEEAGDIVEYTENMNEFDYSLRAADTACYSANFVEFSAAKTKPEKFFEDALLETERMLAAMEVMAKELKL
jgi:hypothetical protein